MWGGSLRRRNLPVKRSSRKPEINNHKLKIVFLNPSFYMVSLIILLFNYFKFLIFSFRVFCNKQNDFIAEERCFNQSVYNVEVGDFLNKILIIFIIFNIYIYILLLKSTKLNNLPEHSIMKERVSNISSTRGNRDSFSCLKKFQVIFKKMKCW